METNDKRPSSRNIGTKRKPSMADTRQHKSPKIQNTPSENEAFQQNHIPMELIVSEILPRLPVKTLMTCSLVSKSWYFLIRNPKFFAIYRSLNLPKSRELCFLNLHDDYITIVSGNMLSQRAKFKAPCTTASTCVVGSCNGLLLFESRRNHECEICWYNPLFRMLKPVDTISLSSIEDRIYGFGYNEVANDFRLVKITFSMEASVEVYSLSRESWHRVQEGPPRRIIMSRFMSGRYCNGAVHWLIETKGGILESIVSYDFKKEVFTDAMLPEELQTDYQGMPDVFEVRGSLALLIDRGEYIIRKYHLWVMTENGVSESWTCKLIISLPATFRWLSCTKDGALLLGYHLGKAFVGFLELETGEVKNVVHSFNAGLLFIEFFWN